MHQLRPAALVAACVFLLTACGGGGGDGGPAAPGNPNPQAPPGSGPPATANITMQSSDDGYSAAVHAFSPTQVTIARNGTVTWVNNTTFSHNVTFTTAGAPTHVPDHTSGSTTRTFPTAGTFAFQCTNHTGMNGSVIVQ